LHLDGLDLARQPLSGLSDAHQSLEQSVATIGVLLYTHDW
jgi:hypothetical protein